MNPLENRIGLHGRCVWIVGAGGGGIGTAICAELANAGAEIIAVDRDRDALAPSRDAVNEAQGVLREYVIDAGDRDAWQAVVAAERDQAKTPFGLVNVVGGLPREHFRSIRETREDAFQSVLDLNLRSAWTASQIFADELVRAGTGGSIVQLTSIVALQAMPFGASYAAAKAALISLARTQALEWGRYEIRVNALAAGTIHTPRSSSQDSERDRRTLPLGRRGTTADIAGAALFLLSDLAAWITGQVLAVDGGASTKPSYLDDQGLPVFVEDPELRERLKTT